MLLEGKTVVLTGGQGGIGSELARQIKDAGAHLIVVDRRAEPDALVADLSDSADVERLCATLAGRDVDVLINLAGLMYFGHLTLQPPQQLAAMIQVNLEQPIRLTQAVLPSMLRRHSGHIVNVGSVFGALPFPHFVSYSATKAGLKAFSEGLRREYAGKGIHVTHIAPRAVKTPFNAGPIAELHQRTRTVNDSPEQVAAAIVKAMTSGRNNLTIGLAESFYTKLNALAPALIDRALRSQRDVAEDILQKQTAQP